MMEIFGSGISSLTTMLGMLGMAVHAGSHCSWSEIADIVGKAQQKVADKVQQTNLEIKIETMKMKGIIALPDGDKMRWLLQSHMTWDGKKEHWESNTTVCLVTVFWWEPTQTESSVASVIVKTVPSVVENGKNSNLLVRKQQKMS